MEPYGAAVATVGNRAQIARGRKPRNQAKTVAVRCVQLPRAAKASRSGLSRSRRVVLRRTCGGYGGLYGAFRSTTVLNASGNRREGLNTSSGAGFDSLFVRIALSLELQLQPSNPRFPDATEKERPASAGLSEPAAAFDSRRAQMSVIYLSAPKSSFIRSSCTPSNHRGVSSQ
jgi:hypothetical protein